MKQNSLIHIMVFFFWTEYYNLKSFLIYRTQAAIWFLYTFFESFYGFITITVIYSISSGIAGWSYFQILALSATSTMAIGIFYTILDPWNMVESMRIGKIDALMIRPYGIVTLLLFNFSVVTSFGGVVSGIIIFAFAISHLSVSALSLAAYILMVAVGTVALVLFLLMITILSYHLFKSARFIYRMGGIFWTAGSYPLSVFGSILMLVFTVVLPIGLASYYPPEVLFGKINFLQYFGVLALAVVIAVLSAIGTRHLMKHYVSGGG